MFSDDPTCMRTHIYLLFGNDLRLRISCIISGPVVAEIVYIYILYRAYKILQKGDAVKIIEKFWIMIDILKWYRYSIL